MRCLALADALARGGARSCFISPALPGHLRRLATGHGHEVLEDEAALASRRWDWLVADHYELGARWEAGQRAHAARVLAIDDIARVHDCDALLDQNLHADMETRYRGKVPPGCRLFLGPAYALLREEFARLRATTLPRTGPVRRIMVQMGGMDSDNQTAKALEAIGMAGPGLAVDVVIGAAHPAHDAVARACAERGYRLHVQPPHLAELMRSADLAVGAAGATSWERCCLGLPAVCVTQAQNQESLAAGLAASNSIVSLGRAESVSAADMAQALGALLREPARLAAMSRACARLVDGAGADRVARHLLETA